MLGHKSLEEELREGNGQTAVATVLSRKDGADIALGFDSNLSTGGPKWLEHEGDIQKHTYTLRVEPVGTPPFEAQIAIRQNHLDGLLAPDVGDRVSVLFDPDDHDKIALDVEASKAQWEARMQGGEHVIRAGETLAMPAPPIAADTVDKLKELAELRSSGALTDEEFASEKAKLLKE